MPAFIIQHRCENVYFLCEPNGVHGIYCCTSCGEYFKKAAKRANIIGSKWRLWNKKEYRVFKRSAWEVSYTRSLNLLQWVCDNPARANTKKKKRKSKSPLDHPRDKKKTPSTQDLLDKLGELASLVQAFVDANE